MLGLAVLLAVGCCALGSPAAYLADTSRLQQLFSAAAPGKDTESAYYVYKGLSLLGAEFDSKAGCDFVKASVDSSSLKSVYHAVQCATALQGCQLNSQDFSDLLSGTIKPGSSSKDLFFALAAMNGLGLKVDSSAREALKKASEDDAALAQAYTLRAAVLLGGDVSMYVSSVEDMLLQADEVDDTYLQYETGVASTAFIVESIYQLGLVDAKALAPLSQERLTKFCNYLLSRAHTSQLRSAFYVISTLRALSVGSGRVPSRLSLASTAVLSAEQPLLQVRASDVLGSALPSALLLTVDSIRQASDSSAVLGTTEMIQSTTDSSVFELNLMESRLSHGFYTVSVSLAVKGQSSVLPLSSHQLSIKVVVPVSLVDVELGVARKDQSKLTAPIRPEFPVQGSSILNADSHEKIILSFVAQDPGKERMPLHQTFVRFESETKEEVLFPVQKQADTSYKLELDIGKQSEKFLHRSGLYSLQLIIGDAVMQNPTVWSLARVKLSLSKDELSLSDVSGQYRPLPEIEHQFRKPEPRPAPLVSLVFSALVLIPFLVMLVMWSRIGVNLSGFSLAPTTIGFHICLAAIFGLYYCYWTQLNMFDALRWLLLLAVPTFFCGNRLLATTVESHQQSKST